MRTAGFLWFAAHEGRLAWRDMKLLTGRGLGSIATLIVLGLTLHLIAALVVHPVPGLAAHPSKGALITVSGMLALSWSLMLSQAVESVTRAFYTRGDLELILSSPVAESRLFAVRIAAMAATIAAMSLALAAPFVNVLAWRGGARWLAIYAVVLALATIAVVLAIVLVAAMFRTIGPKRTRLIAQIAAAFIGAIFAVSLQFAAIQSLGSTDRMAFLQSDAVLTIAPDIDSPLWIVAYAAMGYPGPLLALLTVAALSMAGVIAVFAPRFARYVLTAGSIAADPGSLGGAGLGSRTLSPAQVLRRKEWTLLRRDPWLVSQTLVQILYLLPAAYLLWRGFAGGIDAVTLLVPVLITASGQFAGGLAWLAISGEDAPDLIGTAPVSAGLVVRAKFEAVTIGTLMVFAPFLLVLLALSFRAALAAAVGIPVAALSATAIQYWYRSQARRSRIRHRQTASRFTTYAEALSSVSWAATAALAAAGQWLALAPAIAGGLVLMLARLLSPSRQ